MGYSKTLASQRSVAQPITEPLRGRESEMEQNEAGGYGFTLQDRDRVLRFLILGAVETLYANRTDNIVNNAEVVVRMAKSDGVGLVDLIQLVVENDLAPSKAPAIFALAIAKVMGDDDTRKAVYQLIAKRTVLRTAGQLQDFLLDVNILADGTIPNGAGMRRALQSWLGQSPRWLAEQFLKYRARSKSIGKGQSANINVTDLLRLIRPSGKVMGRDFEQLFSWITKGQLKYKSDENVDGADSLSRYLLAFEEIQSTTKYQRVIELIQEHRFTWEAVPNVWFADDKESERKAIWTALLQNMPPVAMMRNITRMARYGVFENLDSRSLLIKRLVDADFIKKAGLHPVQVFNTYRVYSMGHSPRNDDDTWTVEPAIVNALEKAYYHSYGAVAPTNKRIAFYLDISGSMSVATVASMDGLPVMNYGAILALTLMKTEPDYLIKGFGERIEELHFHGGMSIGDVLDYVSGDYRNSKYGDKDRIQYHGSTDIGMIFRDLLNNRIVVDAVVVITDNVSWEGDSPSPLWKKYLQTVNPNAKLIYLAMTANNASMDDPFEMSSLELVGASADTPLAINKFIAS